MRLSELEEVRVRAFMNLRDANGLRIPVTRDAAVAHVVGMRPVRPATWQGAPLRAQRAWHTSPGHRYRVAGTSYTTALRQPGQSAVAAGTSFFGRDTAHGFAV